MNKIEHKEVRDLYNFLDNIAQHQQKWWSTPKFLRASTYVGSTLVFGGLAVLLVSLAFPIGTLSTQDAFTLIGVTFAGLIVNTFHKAYSPTTKNFMVRFNTMLNVLKDNPEFNDAVEKIEANLPVLTKASIEQLAHHLEQTVNCCARTSVAVERTTNDNTQSIALKFLKL